MDRNPGDIYRNFPPDSENAKGPLFSAILFVAPCKCSQGPWIQSCPILLATRKVALGSCDQDSTNQVHPPELHLQQKSFVFLNTGHVWNQLWTSLPSPECLLVLSGPQVWPSGSIICYQKTQHLPLPLTSIWEVRCHKSEARKGCPKSWWGQGAMSLLWGRCLRGQDPKWEL